VAEEILTEPFNKSKFKGALNQIRTLTRDGPNIFEPHMKELCRKAGVALTFVSELPKTHLSGATRWLRPDKALIMLSLRHRSDDHFWFTFFHKAGHILLHGKTSVFIDEEGRDTNEFEEEANRFAANTLIPERKYKAFVQRGRYYKEDILEFSRALGISPGIIVGRLQHDGKIPFNWHNRLKRKFRLFE
jgi:Zn-dependent peptidase ImmA (M78 family)